MAGIPSKLLVRAWPDYPPVHLCLQAVANVLRTRRARRPIAQPQARRVPTREGTGIILFARLMPAYSVLK